MSWLPGRRRRRSADTDSPPAATGEGEDDAETAAEADGAPRGKDDSDEAGRPEPGGEVVAFTPRPAMEPREWNLWELESANRRARVDRVRAEERRYLLVHLREFAAADGNLPAEFDGLVREAFGDVLQPLDPI